MLDKLRNSLASAISTDGMASTSAKRLAIANTNAPFASTSGLKPTQLERIFKNSGFAKKIITIPVAEALRNGRTWNGDEDQNQIISDIEQRIDLMQVVEEAMIVARIKGGCAILMGFTGQPDVNEPLDLTKIDKDSLLYLQIVHRDMFNPTVIDTRIGASTYGEPAKFILRSFPNHTGQTEDPNVIPANSEIDRSRLLIFKGATYPTAGGLPTWDSFWGLSELQAIYEGVMRAESSAGAIHGLQLEAKISYLMIPDYAKALVKDEENGVTTTEDAVARGLGIMDRDKGNHNTVAVDGSYDIKFNQANFANLDKIDQQFMIRLSGESGIPMTKLFGITPTGLGDSGASNRADFQDLVRGIQVGKIGVGLRRLDQILSIAATNNVEELLRAEWNALETPSDDERAETLVKRIQALTDARALGVIDEDQAKEAYETFAPGNLGEGSGL
ncbi:MAG: DUF1073 domain-containing protein [Gammaproteobacteria bacterium]|nr:DUF1073 domain-containing protein [Gammaproteobacteria bacterium]